MHINARMYEQRNTPYGLAVEVQIKGDAMYDELIMNALKNVSGCYSPDIRWDEQQQTYVVTADWAPDADHGDDPFAIQQRLLAVVPRDCISMHFVRPNEPDYIEEALIDIR